MKDAELPPLPRSAHAQIDPYYGPQPFPFSQAVPEFTADQLRAYALAERAAERERAATIAELYDLGTFEGHAIAGLIRNQGG